MDIQSITKNSKLHGKKGCVAEVARRIQILTVRGCQFSDAQVLVPKGGVGIRLLGYLDSLNIPYRFTSDIKPRSPLLQPKSVRFAKVKANVTVL